MKKLTSTSYALLGLLSRHPWSAYELAQYMQRSIMRRIWPRAESELYKEVKNLVSHKLATQKILSNGGRQRAIYSITPKGNQALDKWLLKTGRNLQYDHEALLKLALSYHVHSEEALHTHISEIEKLAVEEATVIIAVGEELLATSDLMSTTDAPYSTLAVSFIRHIVEAQLKWSQHVKEITRDLDFDKEDNSDWTRKRYKDEIDALRQQLKKHNNR